MLRGQYAVDDADAIWKEIRRNRVIEACQRAGLETGSIPIEILLGAGFTQQEIDALSYKEKQLPVSDIDLR